MNIAIFEWGSLIWWPGGSRIRTQRHEDGPSLPIEFARISRDDRLTLVIQPSAAGQPTCWVLSELSDRNDARQNLKVGERCNSEDIHHVLLNGVSQGAIPSRTAQKIATWACQHTDVDAVVWTGLRSNWQEKRGRDFTIDDATEFLMALEARRGRIKAAYERAREYVTHAPPNVESIERCGREPGMTRGSLPSSSSHLQGMVPKGDRHHRYVELSQASSAVKSVPVLAARLL